MPQLPIMNMGGPTQNPMNEGLANLGMLLLQSEQQKQARADMLAKQKQDQANTDRSLSVAEQNADTNAQNAATSRGELDVKTQALVDQNQAAKDRQAALANSETNKTLGDIASLVSSTVEKLAMMDPSQRKEAYNNWNTRIAPILSAQAAKAGFPMNPEDLQLDMEKSTRNVLMLRALQLRFDHPEWNGKEKGELYQLYAQDLSQYSDNADEISEALALPATQAYLNATAEERQAQIDKANVVSSQANASIDKTKANIVANDKRTDQENHNLSKGILGGTGGTTLNINPVGLAGQLNKEAQAGTDVDTTALQTYNNNIKGLIDDTSKNATNDYRVRNLDHTRLIQSWTGRILSEAATDYNYLKDVNLPYTSKELEADKETYKLLKAHRFFDPVLAFGKRNATVLHLDSQADKNQFVMDTYDLMVEKGFIDALHSILVEVKSSKGVTRAMENQYGQ